MSAIKVLVSYLSGLTFAVGLGVAGMTQPAKVIGFLDITGDWDPSLAFVMVGAIAVHALAYRLVPHMSAPWFSERFGIPTRRDINARLIGGAVLFGLGWGIGGFCPGPALVAVTGGMSAPLLFCAAMLGGMALFRGSEALLARGGQPCEDAPGLIHPANPRRNEDLGQAN